MSSTVVVIPCLNEVRYIGKCLDSLMQQRDFNGSLEVIVVDGGSTDGTLEVLEDYKGRLEGLSVLHNAQRVTPVSLNMGLKASDAEVKIILGAHSTLSENFLSEVGIAMESHPEAGCVGGVIDNIFENELARYIGLAMSSPFGVGNATFRIGGADGYVDTVAFGAYRKEVFDQLGYFDEELVRNQDDEFNYRLIKGGFKIWFTGKIKSFYYVRGEYEKLFRQYYQYGYWKVFVNKKHKAVTSVRQLVPAIFVFCLFINLMGSVFFLELFWGFSLYLLLYLGAGLYFASRKAKDLRERFKILGVFFILHVSYGSGYLKGIFDFLILRRMPSGRAKTITR